MMPRSAYGPTRKGKVKRAEYTKVVTQRQKARADLPTIEEKDMTANYAGAYYVTGLYEEQQDTHTLPRLTQQEQQVISAAREGPGVTPKELYKYFGMLPAESNEAIGHLLELDLILEGPVEDWML